MLTVNHPFYHLMLVTRRLPLYTHEYLNFIRRCLSAGVTSIQLREKEAEDSILYPFARSLKLICDDFGVPLIVNDRIELAIALDAAGVHLGQDDHNPIFARSRLGEKKIIGFSVNFLEEVTFANSLPIDYIGVGAVFSTKSKPDIAHIWGLNELKEGVSCSKHPVIAIGGINEKNMGEVLKAGAKGVAMISCLHDAIHPEIVIKECLQHLQQHESGVEYV